MWTVLTRHAKGPNGFTRMVQGGLLGYVVGFCHHQMHASADLKSLRMACGGVCGKFPGFGHQRAIICALHGNMGAAPNTTR